MKEAQKLFKKKVPEPEEGNAPSKPKIINIINPIKFYYDGLVEDEEEEQAEEVEESIDENGNKGEDVDEGDLEEGDGDELSEDEDELLDDDDEELGEYEGDDVDDGVGGTGMGPPGFIHGPEPDSDDEIKYNDDVSVCVCVHEALVNQLLQRNA